MTSARSCADTYVPEPPCCTYGLRVPAFCVLYVPEAQALYVRATRASIGRAVCTTYRGTTGKECSEGFVGSILNSCSPADQPFPPKCACCPAKVFMPSFDRHVDDSLRAVFVEWTLRQARRPQPQP
eukprot:scaffold21748_cov51-Phaeocystis_antarctica.AAC.1